MNVDHVGDVTVIALSGDFSGLEPDVLNVTQQSLFEILDHSAPYIVLDLADVKHFGSTFIEMMFRVWNRVNRKNGRMAFCRMQPLCFSIFHTAKLDTLWQIYDTRDEAIRYASEA